MDAREKIDAALAHLKEQKVARNTAAPPFWRLCWRAGLLIPPPHFLGFLTILLLFGVPFGLAMNLFGLAFLLTIGAPINWGFGMMGLSSALFFGGAMAVYYRWSARRLGLPKWSEFRPGFNEPDDSW